MLALQAPRAADLQDGQPFFFDAPTALFTVNDFYDALNRRREEQGKEPLNPETVCRCQNGQIDSFFCHMALLFDTDAGFAAIRDIVPSREDLAELRQFLQEVTMAELESRYPG